MKPCRSLRSISRQKVISHIGRETLKVTALPFFIFRKCTQGRGYFSRAYISPAVEKQRKEAVSGETADRSVQSWTKCSGIAEVSSASPLPEQPPHPNIGVASLLPLFVLQFRDGSGEGRVSEQADKRWPFSGNVSIFQPILLKGH